jgi:hypothetical protein
VMKGYDDDNEVVMSLDCRLIGVEYVDDVE